MTRRERWAILAAGLGVAAALALLLSRRPAPEVEAPRPVPPARPRPAARSAPRPIFPPRAADPAPPPPPAAPVVAPPPASPARPDGPRGDIVFRVLAAESGEPVAGAEVTGQSWTVEVPNPGPGGAPKAAPKPAEESREGGEVVPPEEGDPPGRIRIRGCPPARHTIQVRGPGRAPGKLEVDVVAGVETQAPDVLLDPEARIRCLVLDDEGKPRPGVEVNVVEGIFHPTRAEGTTDENGSVVLGGLPGGTQWVGALKGPDSMVIVSTTPGETTEMVMGGLPQLEVCVGGVEEIGRSLVLVPLVPGMDPLLISKRGRNIPAGTRLVPSKEKGRFLVGGLAPGRWFVVPEGDPISAVAEVPAVAADPVRVELRAATVRVRFRRAGESGESSVGVAALREGDAESALAGDPEALLRLLIAEFERQSIRLDGPLSEADVVVPGEGNCVLFFGGGDLFADPLPVAVSASAPPQAPVVDLVPASLLRVECKAVEVEKGAGGEKGAGAEKGAEGSAEGRRWHYENHLVAARDDSGRVRALRLDDGNMKLRLPPGRWHIEFRGPGGMHRSGVVVVPEIGEAEFLVE